MSALVADDGNSIITIDNWGSLGYGDNVMVIYNGEGEIEDQYRLGEFSPFPIESYQISVTSIWWNCGSSYIDNDNVKICFKSKDGQIIERIYNRPKREFK